MAKIYRMSDRIPVKIHDLKVVIGPLDIHQKMSVEEAAASSGLLKATIQAMKYAIKDIEGLIDKDGNEYELNRDPDGSLTDECLNDLFNIEHSYALSSVCLNLLTNIPDEFMDPNTGEKLDGVEFVVDKGGKGKKPKATSSK